MNRLAESLSPYLLQHADNPVDWRPWDEVALARARAEDRPIFLSIGYSACHWCHVMAHESFEDPRIAALLNQHFVCIKLDREERPDLDEIYMSATQTMTGHGGWPMSVFLTPDLEPFFAGTYFPPVPRYGHPGFVQVIEHLAAAWREQRSAVVQQARALTDAMRRMGELEPGNRLPGREPIERLAQQLDAGFDPRHGGFSGPPKFPDHQGMSVLLGLHALGPAPRALEQTLVTLERMALGGIYDQLGGGFARYSVDEEWLVPHFEKMLYDNACLARTYLAAWQATGDGLMRQVVEGTLDYLLREMTGEAGGFYSAQDADSEGEEGKFYVWTTDELRDVLGEAAEEFALVYGASRSGNFEGQNILHLTRRLDQWERERPGIGERLATARARLKQRRDRRIWPGTDDKVLVEWNGLAIGALARCGAALERPDYIDAAARAAAFIRDTMWDSERLHRVYRAGRHHTAANQADYAAYADGLIELFCARPDPAWLAEARRTLERMVERFGDPSSGAFFFGEESPELLVRSRHPHDNPYPSGNTLAVRAMLALARLIGEPRWRELAEGVLAAFGPSLLQHPRAHAGMIGALQAHLAPHREVVVCGPPDQTAALARVARRSGWPGLLVLEADSAAPGHAALVEACPLFAARAPTVASAYVCEDSACRLPITDPAVLAEALG